MTDRARPGTTTGRPTGRRRRALVLGAVAALVLGAAGLAALSGLVTGAPGSPTPSATAASTCLGGLTLVTVPPTVPAASPAPTPTAPTVATDTAPPSATASPAIATEVRAKRIRIERLEINLPIVEGDGVDAPLGKAAHYPGTAWPGGGSNIYLYAHARRGMFLALWRAKVGDRIELDLVDGTTRTYVVRRILPRVAYNAVSYLRPTKAERLTLQTCTSNRMTSPRFIVIAVPAP